MMGQLIKMEILKKLKTEFGSELYRHDNVVLSAIHTHQGPGGYIQYLMLSVPSFGFVEDSFQVPRTQKFSYILTFFLNRSLHPYIDEIFSNRQEV